MSEQRIQNPGNPEASSRRSAPLLAALILDSEFWIPAFQFRRA